MAVTDTTIISNTVLYIRDLLLNNITDPKQSVRPATSKFVMTEFPKRQVSTYPVIIVEQARFSTAPLGMASNNQFTSIGLRITIFSLSPKQSDTLTQDVYNVLRTKQETASTGSIANNLVDFQVTNVSNPPPEPVGGYSIYTKIIDIDYNYVTGD